LNPGRVMKVTLGGTGDDRGGREDERAHRGPDPARVTTPGS